MLLLRLAPFALLAGAGGAAAHEDAAQYQSGGVLADHVVVDKTARTLTAYASGTPLRVIEGIQLGDAPVGHKRFQGDERTPEGRYVIDWGNPQSAFTLSLHVCLIRTRPTPPTRPRSVAAPGA